MASQCWMAGRIEAAVGYSDAGQSGYRQWRATRCRSASRACSAVRTWSSASPNGGSSGAAPSSHAVATPTRITRACLVIALTIAGSGEEAMAAANGLIDAAEATRNPHVLSFALLAYGFAFRDADPAARAGRPAPGPGDRSRQRQPIQSNHTWRSSCPALRPNTATRWPRSITSRWRSATTTTRATPRCCAARWLSSPLFSTGSDATNRRPPSPDSPLSPLTAARVPRDQHRDHPPARCPRRPDLRIARPQGRDMTTAAMATYAYDQIDQARAELNAVSK